MESRRWRSFTLCALVSLTAADIGCKPDQVIFRKANDLTVATFQIPGSDLEIALDRRCIHLFLAEYERTLILRKGGQELLRSAVAIDTGGYSRLGVYQVSQTVFYLDGFLDFDRYWLDISGLSVTQDIGAEVPAVARFVGAFDRDEKGWRFIPASETRRDQIR